MDPTIAYEKVMRRVMMARGARPWRTAWRGEQLSALVLRGRGPLPPVVLMHGFSASGPTQWTSVAARLRPHHQRLFVPDLPGHGESRLRAPLDAETMLEASRALLLGMLDEPAILVASSMSGGIATRLASQHPERVCGLVLCSPGGAPLDTAQVNRLLELFEVDSFAKALSFVDHVFARPPVTRPIIAWGARRQLRRPHLVALLQQLEGQPWLQPHELRGLRMPVKLLWGAADRVLPTSNYLFFKEYLPPGSVIERPDYGHAPFLEAPAELAASVLSFSRKLVSPSLVKVAPASRRVPLSGSGARVEAAANDAWGEQLGA